VKKYLVNVEAEVAIFQDHFVVAGQPILMSLQKHLLVKVLRIINTVKSPKVK
jgi:hypothetical protein